MSRELDIVTLSGKEYDELLEKAESSSEPACSTDFGPMEKLENFLKNIPDARVRLKARDLWKQHCRGPVELYQVDGGIRFVFEDWQLVLSVR